MLVSHSLEPGCADKGSVVDLISGNFPEISPIGPSLLQPAKKWQHTIREQWPMDNRQNASSIASGANSGASAGCGRADSHSQGSCVALCSLVPRLVRSKSLQATMVPPVARFVSDPQLRAYLWLKMAKCF